MVSYPLFRAYMVKNYFVPRFVVIVDEYDEVGANFALYY